MATHFAPLSAEQLREAERATMVRVPEAALMDAAAAAVVAECPQVNRVVVLVGRGNNGGDALLAGALLAREGADVTAVLLTPDAHPRGLASLAEAGGRVAVWSADEAATVGAAQLVVDGIVGLGGRAGLRPDAAEAVAAITPGTTVIAVDLPSGLAPDSPSAEALHVRADVTVTFTAPKVCLVRQPAAASAGRVVIADVGVDLASVL